MSPWYAIREVSLLEGLNMCMSMLCMQQRVETDQRLGEPDLKPGCGPSRFLTLLYPPLHPLIHTMAYNLPPISTLSAVLGGDEASPASIQITPELLDESVNQSNGQETDNRHESNHNPHQQWTTDSHYQ
jgi:hypothetical protein